MTGPGRPEDRPVRVANCSGFFGDRLSAAAEMVSGGPVDVLTGDWLAELTMLLLARQRATRGNGYARTFLTQMRQVLGPCLERGTKVVSNAGGLDPAGCAAALREQAAAAGLSPRIAVVDGDDLVPRLGELAGLGEAWTNLDTGEALGTLAPLTANAYLGGRGITAALAAGADVVVTGRVTDAALVVGPAAWWHGWSYGGPDGSPDGRPADLDALAGAVVAGHVIECGAQATGGNYPFFDEVPGLEHPGFPLAEVAADGGSVITKHPGTGGLVSVGTVTAQLLYELGGPAYANPDVVADFASVRLSSDGPDRVRIGGVRGTPPPDRLKVALNAVGGFRNTMALVLTGLHVREKAALALRTLTGLGLDEALAGDPADLGPRSTLGVRELHVELVESGVADPATTAAAQSHLRLTVKDADPAKVGRAFTGRVVESALATYPGMFPTAPPGDGTPFGVYWPTTVAAGSVRQRVRLDAGGGELAEVAEVPAGGAGAAGGEPGAGARAAGHAVAPGVDAGAPHAAPAEVPAAAGGTPGDATPGAATARVPLGALVGARSGDKGGDANVGLWAPEGPRADAVAAWLAATVTPGWVRALLPEAAGLAVDVHRLPNLRAVNVVVHGLLGRGVADSTRLDPQAKGLGEHLRARLVDVPAALLPGDAAPGDAAPGDAPAGGPGAA